MIYIGAFSFIKLLLSISWCCAKLRSLLIKWEWIDSPRSEWSACLLLVMMESMAFKYLLVMVISEAVVCMSHMMNRLLIVVVLSLFMMWVILLMIEAAALLIESGNILLIIWYFMKTTLLSRLFVWHMWNDIQARCSLWYSGRYILMICEVYWLKGCWSMMCRWLDIEKTSNAVAAAMCSTRMTLFRLIAWGTLANKQWNNGERCSSAEGVLASLFEEAQAFTTLFIVTTCRSIG